VLAVDALDLDVRRGEIYGFLGRNGAMPAALAKAIEFALRALGYQGPRP